MRWALAFFVFFALLLIGGAHQLTEGPRIAGLPVGQLNGAKFAVIGAMEEKLPAYVYSRAEWKALGEGRDWRRYLPLTYVEQRVPLSAWPPISRVSSPRSGEMPSAVTA